MRRLRQSITASRQTKPRATGMELMSIASVRGRYGQIECPGARLLVFGLRYRGRDAHAPHQLEFCLVDGLRVVADRTAADAQERRLALDRQRVGAVDHRFALSMPALDERAFHKIIPRCQLVDLGVQHLEVNRRLIWHAAGCVRRGPLFLVAAVLTVDVLALRRSGHLHRVVQLCGACVSAAGPSLGRSRPRSHRRHERSARCPAQPGPGIPRGRSGPRRARGRVAGH